MLELVIVLLVTSILAVAIFVQSPGKTVNLRAQAEQIASDIRYTQALAMTHGERFNFIQTSATTYQIRNNAGTAVQLPMGNTTATLASGITFGTLVNLPNSLIAFNGQGVPYTTNTSPGTTLASAASIPLTASGETRTVVISPETGRVTIQ